LIPSIFVTCSLPASVLAKLQAAGTVDVYTGDATLSPAELRLRVADKQVLVCLLTDAIDSQVFDAAPWLKIVANIAVGFNNIDVARARARGIIVTNTPDVLTESVADFTWALLLSITRRVSEGERLVRSGRWKGWALDFMLGSGLAGKQLGVVGFGRIGRAVASRAAAFAMHVVYSSRREPRTSPEHVSFDHLLATSDVVSLHVPLTPDTRHLIDARALAKMKRTAYLVNTSRGPVVDEAALAHALGEGDLAGAALDVYEHEPQIHPGLLQLENVVLAPHLGSATVETRTAMADLAVDNVLAVLAGRRPLTPVP
jgi:glyoxylate reductase